MPPLSRLIYMLAPVVSLASNPMQAANPAPFSQGVPESCSAPSKLLTESEALDWKANFVGALVEQTTGTLQPYAVELSSAFVTVVGEENGKVQYLASQKPSWAANAGKYVHIYKAYGALAAFGGGDDDALLDMALTETAEKVAEFALHSTGQYFSGSAGANAAAVVAETSATATATAGGSTVSTFATGLSAGFIVAALKTTKDSYDYLEEQDCLLNIDIGYYTLLDDPKLRFQSNEPMPSGAVDHFIRNYIVGGGEDRAKNRRIMQCYVNKAGELTGDAWLHDPDELPEDRLLYPIDNVSLNGKTITMTVIDRYESGPESAPEMVEDIYRFEGELTAGSEIVGTITGRVLDRACEEENLEALVDTALSSAVTSATSAASGAVAAVRGETDTRAPQSSATPEWRACGRVNVSATWRVSRR